MRLFIKLAFAPLLALAAIALTGASSDTATARQALPAIDNAAAEQMPLLEEVTERRRHWGKRGGGKHWAGKHYSRKWRSHKRHFKPRFRKRFYQRPRIYLRYSHPRYYDYYDDYEDDAYYSASCGTHEEKERCARKFRSFNWDTCRYTTYSGHQRLCPYVR